MRVGFANFLVSVILGANVAFSQTTLEVTVGDTGSFFIPQIVTAKKGDIVSFKWTERFHSVTQSSFEEPCTPLAGGFDSGVTGNPPNITIFPVWNLTITDDSKPIWFFCKATIPVFHCSSGMVGAINAVPSGADNSFETFQQKAKAITDAPELPKSAPPSLTGIGAKANATPIPLINPNATSTNSSSSSTSSTTSSTLSKQPATTSIAASPVATASSDSGLTRSTIGGIVGGVVGAVALTLLVVLAFLSYRRAVRYKREAMVANKMLRDKEAESGFLQIGTPGGHRPPASVAMSDGTEAEGSSAVNNINVKELAAEIARSIRQETETDIGSTKGNWRPGASSSIKSQARALPMPPPMPPQHGRSPNPHDSFDQSLPPYNGRH